MSNQNSIKNNGIQKQVLFIINNLRSLGLKSSHYGFKLLIKALEIKLSEENEFSTLEVVYQKLSITTNKTPKQIEDCIYYAITHRNYQLSKDSFEKVFGYPYDEEIFSNKEFIEELVCLIQITKI